MASCSLQCPVFFSLTPCLSLSFSLPLSLSLDPSLFPLFHSRLPSHLCVRHAVQCVCVCLCVSLSLLPFGPLSWFLFLSHFYHFLIFLFQSICLSLILLICQYLPPKTSKFKIVHLFYRIVAPCSRTVCGQTKTYTTLYCRYSTCFIVSTILTRLLQNCPRSMSYFGPSTFADPSISPLAHLLSAQPSSLPFSLPPSLTLFRGTVVVHFSCQAHWL